MNCQEMVDLQSGVGGRSGLSDPQRDMRQRFFDLIDQDQAQVAWLKAFQRKIRRRAFTPDFMYFCGAASIRQTLAQ